MDINFNILEFNQSTEKNFKQEEYSIIINEKEYSLNQLLKFKKIIQLRNIKHEILLRLMHNNNLIAFGSIEQKTLDLAKKKQKNFSFWQELHSINKTKNNQKKLQLKICISFPKNSRCHYSFIDTNLNNSDLFTFSKVNLNDESINSDIKKKSNKKREITERSIQESKLQNENYKFKNLKLMSYKHTDTHKKQSFNETKKLFSDNKKSNKIKLIKQNNFNNNKTIENRSEFCLLTNDISNDKRILKNKIHKNLSTSAIQKPTEQKIPISYQASVRCFEAKKENVKPIVINKKNIEKGKNIKLKKDILNKTDNSNKIKISPKIKNQKYPNRKNITMKTSIMNNSTFINIDNKRGNNNALISLTQSEKEILLSESDYLLTSPMTNNFNKFQIINSKINNNNTTLDAESTSKRIKLELINDINKELLKYNCQAKTNKNKNIDLNQYISTVVINNEADLNELNKKERKNIKKKNLIKLINDFNEKECLNIKHDNNSYPLRNITLQEKNLYKNIRMNSLDITDYNNNVNNKTICLTDKNKNNNFDVKDLIKSEKDESENNILNIFLLNDDKKQRIKLMELDNRFSDIKNDFELLYNKKFILSISNDLINFELNLCVEKAMTLLYYYHKSVLLFYENKFFLIKLIKILKFRIKDQLKKCHRLKYKEEFSSFEKKNNKNEKYTLNIKNDKLIPGNIFSNLFEKEYNPNKNFKNLFKKIIQKQINDANKKKDNYKLGKIINLLKEKNKNNFFNEYIISSSKPLKTNKNNLPQNINNKKTFKKNKTENVFTSQKIITKNKHKINKNNAQ